MDSTKIYSIYSRLRDAADFNIAFNNYCKP